ncbi:EF-hand calcium-binding domain-containing protein 4B-like [Dysidea avara]|uniref:EF-hand calcium-binding domain-containing protein 4B-like n=1 Tax=Dysidea avara TaxID=196820 RepID=UPI0033348AC3
MNKLSIDSQTPMFQSTELKDLINQMQFQSPHLLGILEKVISVLHDDWQECKLSCENLQTKLNSDAQHREELAVEYDEMLTEELEKERMTFVVKQHQLKTKLDKQLQEKEDNILQVISQKRTLERQLSVEKKERVILKKQNKELESTIKHMEDTISASQPPSLQRQRSIVDVLRVTSCTEFEPGAKKRQLLIRLLSQTSMDPLSRTTSLEFSQNDHCDTTTDQDKYSKHHDQDDIIDDADGDQDEYFDAVESTSDLSLPHTDHTSENISSIPSLAEEFEQEGHQYESMASVSGITQSTEDSPCHVYKVVYLGNNGVGKTSIIRWLLTGNFHSTVKSTQGVNYTTSKLSIDNENVLLELWDTAGQDEYGAITSVYCHNANAFVLVYDISSHGSFTTIRRWTDLIKIIRSVSTVLLLIGNKVDVSHCSRQVSTSEGEELSEELGATFIETSAKLGRNIMKAHEDLLRKLVEREQELVKPEIQGIILNPANPIDKRNFYCY